jgi:hypothetical protein
MLKTDTEETEEKKKKARAKAGSPRPKPPTTIPFTIPTTTWSMRAAQHHLQRQYTVHIRPEIEFESGYKMKLNRYLQVSTILNGVCIMFPQSFHFV